jgi:hypothetical protein
MRAAFGTPGEAVPVLTACAVADVVVVITCPTSRGRSGRLHFRR